jgi:hypothetical protein
MSVPVNSFGRENSRSGNFNFYDFPNGVNVEILEVPEAIQRPEQQEQNVLEQLEAYLQDLVALRNRLNPGGEYDNFLQNLMADHEENEQPAELEPASENTLELSFETETTQPQRAVTPPPSFTGLRQNSLFIPEQRDNTIATPPTLSRSHSI